MDLYNEILELFEERQFIKTRDLIPTYICSIGSHIFNIVNKEKEILLEGGQMIDTRSHIFMITIPGFGKSHVLNQFLQKKYGMIANSEVDVGKLAEISAAGLLGSIKSTPDANKVKSTGRLERDKFAILGCEEFSNITSGKKQAYNANLINALLIALDSGEMNKDQSAGGFEFETYTTIWGATQPARIDMESGMNRRFLFVLYMPTYADSQELTLVRRRSKNLNLDIKKLLTFKSEFNKRVNDVKSVIKKVSFKPEYYNYVEQFYNLHFEEMLFERLAIGYWIMKVDKIPEHLEIILDDELKRIIKMQVDTRLQIQKGINKVKVMDIMNEVGIIEKDKLIKILIGFTLNYETEIKGSLGLLIQRGILIEEDGMIKKGEE